MTDDRLRDLERKALRDGDMEALERYKLEWLRLQSWRECEKCKAHVPVDAWDVHQAGCGAPPPSGSGIRASAMPVVMIPSTGALGGRPGKHPIFDRVVLEPDQHHVEFFQDTNKPLWDTNLPGPGGRIPAGWHFFLYGLSLIPDAGDRPEDVMAVWNRSVLTVEIPVGSRFHPFPARTIMGEQPYVEEQEREDREFLEAVREFDTSEVMVEPDFGLVRRLRDDGPVRLLTVNSKPWSIPELMDFGFRLEISPEVTRTGPVGLMLVLYGLPFVGIVA